MLLIVLNSKVINYVNKLIKELNLTNYIGIIVYGSYIGNRTNKLSDLDVMIIKDNYETQDCGSLLIDDIRVEYFIQDLKRLYQLIKNKVDNNDKFSIFSINNRIEDSESLIDEESFYAIYYITLEKIRNLYSKIDGIIDLPIMKIEKIYNDNSFAKKYISSSSHCLPNQNFIDLYLQCIKIYDKNVMLDNIKKLYSYSFKQLDFNSENFV